MTIRLAALAAGLVTSALTLPAPAAADPPPPPAPGPVLPAPAQLIPAIGSVLAQAGSPAAGPLGLPDLSSHALDLVLGQNAAPAPPGAPTVTVPDLRALNPNYLLSQNLAPAPPGQGTPAPGLGPSEDIPGTGRIDFLRRIYEMYQAGALKGSLLGQQSPDEFADQASIPPPSPAG